MFNARPGTCFVCTRTFSLCLLGFPKGILLHPTVKKTSTWGELGSSELTIGASVGGNVGFVYVSLCVPASWERLQRTLMTPNVRGRLDGWMSLSGHRSIGRSTRPPHPPLQLHAWRFPLLSDSPRAVSCEVTADDDNNNSGGSKAASWLGGRNRAARIINLYIDFPADEKAPCGCERGESRRLISSVDGMAEEGSGAAFGSGCCTCQFSHSVQSTRFRESLISSFGSGRSLAPEQTRK